VKVKLNFNTMALVWIEPLFASGEIVELWLLPTLKLRQVYLHLTRNPVRLWWNSGIVTPTYAKASAGLPSFESKSCSPLVK